MCCPPLGLLDVVGHALGDGVHAEERDVVNVSRTVGADAGEVTEDLLLQAPALDGAGQNHR